MRLCQKQLCKGLKSENFSSKKELNKKEILILNRGAYVLHFWKRIKKKFVVILMGNNYVIIRNFGL